MSDEMIGFLEMRVVWYSANSSSRPSLSFFFPDNEEATNLAKSTMPSTATPTIVFADLNVL